MADDRNHFAPLARLAESRRRSTLATLFAIMAALVGLLLLLLAAADTHAMWPGSVRFALLALLLATLGTGLALSFRKARSHDVPEAARALEAASPESGQLLRTAVEYAGQAPSPDPLRAAFVERLIGQSATTLTKVDEDDSLVPNKNRRIAMLAAAIVIALIPVLAVSSADLRLALGRILAPGSAATYSRLVWTGLPESFDDQHPPRLEFRVDGRHATPELSVRSAGSPWEQVALTPRPDSRIWDVVLTGRSSDLEARLRAGDARPALATIAFRPVPRLVSSGLTIRFPDYTGIGESSPTSSDARAVEGSVATWSFIFNTPPVRTEWTLGDGAPRVITLDADAPSATVTETLVVGKSTAALAIFDTRGERIDSWRFEVEGTEDRLPSLGLLEPKKDLTATPITEIPVRIRARDDYGLAEVGLVLEASGKRRAMLEKVIDARDLRLVNEHVRAMLETFPMEITDNVRLFAYATDHKPRDGARAVSPLVSIDIRDFKRRYIFLTRPPRDPKAQEDPVPDLQVIEEKLLQVAAIIKKQRAILSAIFTVKEANPGEPSEEATRKAKEQAEAERALSESALLLFDTWIASGDIPIDDLTLLDTASTQMGEAAGFLETPDLAQGFTSGDQALGSLIALRKRVLTLLQRGVGPERNSDEIGPPSLRQLAAVARRLAREEHGIMDQIAPENLPGTNLEATRRQQEATVTDAGELYAALVDHPERSEGAVALMDLAEKSMLEADEKLNQRVVTAASPLLAAAERQLLDLAVFLESLDEQRIPDTLREMADKSEDAEEETRNPEIGEESGDAETPAETAAETEENARETRMAEEILRELAERQAAGNLEDGTDDPAGLEELRQRAGAAATDLEQLAAQQAGGGPREPKTLAEEAAGNLQDMARELRAEARRRDANRLEQLTEAAEKARQLREALEAEQRRMDTEDDPFSRSAKEQDPGKDKPKPPGGGGGPSKEQPAAPHASNDPTAIDLGELADDLARLRDPALNKLAAPLHQAAFDPVLIPAIEAAEQRLRELIAGIPTIPAPSTGRSRVPEQHRREIEDYYRDLSDDFGGEIWEKPNH